MRCKHNVLGRFWKTTLKAHDECPVLLLHPLFWSLLGMRIPGMAGAPAAMLDNLGKEAALAEVAR